jgi:hypothetical protein
MKCGGVGTGIAIGARFGSDCGMERFDFSAFESEALAEGYDEVLERRWPADAVVEEHTHPFAVRALLIKGEMWLTADESPRHLKVGDTFELDHGVPHAERYGVDGATYWVARRGGNKERGA